MLKRFSSPAARGLAGAALLVFCCLASMAEAADTKLYDLFWRRAWSAMDELYASKRDKSPREHALMVNALRLRGKWPEAVAILEAQRDTFPVSIRPYADMTLLLGTRGRDGPRTPCTCPSGFGKRHRRT